MIDPAFTWGDDRPPHTPWERTIIYERMCAAITKLHPAVPRGAARHLPRPDRAGRASTTSSSSASPRSSCCRCTRSSTTATCSTRGSRITGATTRSAFFAPGPRYARVPDFAFARVQGDGRALPRCRHRGHPRRRLQPHRRRQRARPDAVVQGHRQRLLLPAAARPAALLHQRYRHRQHAEPVASARAADGHRLAALLGAGDARRRLPLRPRHDPGARAARLRRGRRVSRFAAARIRCCRRSS